MQRHIHTNLDFEYQLRFGDAWTRPKPLIETLSRWRYILRLVPGWHDALPTDAWGQDNTLYWGIGRPGAGLDVGLVRRVNSKVFSHEFAKEAGVELPGATLCSSVAQLEQVLEAQTAILKHPLGFSGRERIEVCGELDERQRGWANRVLAEGPILVEPKVSLTREWSLQFDVGEQVDFLGTALLLVDRHGQHRGHVVGWDAPNTEILAIATDAAWAVHRAGKCGSLGC
ncbi:MAG: hypothetical protein R3E66_11430 [bacterium]